MEPVRADEVIERAAMRARLASRALEGAADDLFLASRRGAPVNGGGMRVELEVTRVETLAAEIEALRSAAV